ncbi:MAG: transketolase C-terminal domain-containing protein, partial [Promethearchaeota archaeon]
WSWAYQSQISMPSEDSPGETEKFKISAKVINLSSVKPIDFVFLMKELNNMKGIIFIEEHSVYCGFGSILARIVSERYPIPMKFIGINNTFCKSGERIDVLQAHGITVDNIVNQVNNLFNIE